MRPFVIFPTLAISVVLAAGTMFPQDASSRFYEAIRNDDTVSVRSLIRQAGGNVRDTHGTTPLMYAAAVGSLETVSSLISAGADVNAKNSFGATALLWSTADFDKVRLLLSKGANVNARSQFGRTPLFVAALHDGGSAVLKLLLDEGADVSVRDKAGMTPVEAAALANDSESVRMLLARGAAYDAKDGVGFTALMCAALNGNAEIARLLIAAGADVNAVSIETFEVVKNGPIALGFQTPLQFAATFSNYDVAELLLRSGARADFPDVRGMTPLSLTVTSDHPDKRLLRLLLAKGANPRLKSRAGETAIDWARKFGDPSVLELFGLPQNQASVIADPRKESPRPIPTIKEAVEGSASLLQRTSKTFLQHGGCVACHAQNLTGIAVSAALSQGADVDVRMEQEQVRTVLSLRSALGPTLLQLVDPPPVVSGIEYTLLHLHAAAVPGSAQTDPMVIYVAAAQRKEGNWPNNESMRPPLADSDFARTAMGIRCLQVYGFRGRKAEFNDRIKRAAGWLNRTSPVTTDDRVMQLLGIMWGSGTRQEFRLKELLGLQHDSGGWAQRKTLLPDAYATGEALYALHELGIPSTSPAYRRGVDFLLQTRMDDGSWHVRSRAAGFQPYFQSGFPHEHDQWISAAGTAWAVIALAYAMPTESTIVTAGK